MKSYRQMAARIGGVLLLASAFVVMNAAQSDAALMVWICNDAACAGEVPVTDNLAGDVNPTLGAITVITPAGSVELASTYPFLGTPTEPVLNLTYSFGRADFVLLSGTPFVYAAQTGFLLSPGTAIFDANASNGGGTATAWAGTFPSVFNPPGNPLEIIGGPCLMPCSDTGNVPAAPYFLAVGVAVTPGAGGGASGDATVTVPEPASMALFGLGLFAVGVVSRRRKLGL